MSMLIFNPWILLFLFERVLIITIASEHKELVVLGQFVFHDNRVGYLGK